MSLHALVRNRAQAAVGPASGGSLLRKQMRVAGAWLAVAAVVAFQLSRHRGGLDLHIYWRAAHAMARGVSPYADRRFVYPPFAAVLVAPLGHLGWPTVHTLGSLATVLAVVLTVLVSARALGVRLLSWKLAAVAAVIAAGHMFFASTALGNLSALIALLLAAFYLLTTRRLDWAAGATLGASLAIKPMLLPVLVVPLLWGRWRTWVATVTTAIACTGVGVLVVPHSEWFLTRAVPYLRSTHRASFDPLNSTLASVGHMVGVPVVIVVLARVLVVLVSLAVVVAVRIRRPQLSALTAVTAGSAALLAQFCSGGLTEDHFLLTLIPLFVTLAADESDLCPAVAWPSMIAISGIVNAPVSWYSGGQRAQWAVGTSVRLLGQLGVLAAFLCRGLGYGPPSWSRTRWERTSSPPSPWLPESASASRCDGSSAA